MAGVDEDFTEIGWVERAYDMGVGGVQSIDRRIEELSGLSQYGLTEAMVWTVLAIVAITSTRALTRPMVDQGMRERRQKADREDHMFRKEHGLWPYHQSDTIAHNVKVSEDLPTGYEED